MAWNATIPDDRDLGFQKVVILALKTKGTIGNATF